MSMGPLEVDVVAKGQLHLERCQSGWLVNFARGPSDFGVIITRHLRPTGVFPILSRFGG